MAETLESLVDIIEGKANADLEINRTKLDMQDQQLDIARAMQDYQEEILDTLMAINEKMNPIVDRIKSIRGLLILGIKTMINLNDERQQDARRKESMEALKDAEETPDLLPTPGEAVSKKILPRPKKEGGGLLGGLMNGQGMRAGLAALLGIPLLASFGWGFKILTRVFAILLILKGVFEGLRNIGPELETLSEDADIGDKLLTAILGFTEGFLKGTLGWILDTIRVGFSWALRKLTDSDDPDALGNRIADLLDAFSFNDIIDFQFEHMKTVMLGIKEDLTKVFKTALAGPMDFISVVDIVFGLFDMVKNAFKRSIQSIIAKLASFDTVGKYIPKSVLSFFGVGPGGEIIDDLTPKALVKTILETETEKELRKTEVVTRQGKSVVTPIIPPVPEGTEFVAQQVGSWSAMAGQVKAAEDAGDIEGLKSLTESFYHQSSILRDQKRITEFEFQTAAKKYQKYNPEAWVPQHDLGNVPQVVPENKINIIPQAQIEAVPSSLIPLRQNTKSIENSYIDQVYMTTMGQGAGGGQPIMITTSADKTNNINSTNLSMPPVQVEDYFDPVPRQQSR